MEYLAREARHVLLQWFEQHRRDPRMEVGAELGTEEGWPRGGAPSRGVVALRRVCGLLMVEPCR